MLSLPDRSLYCGPSKAYHRHFRSELLIASPTNSIFSERSACGTLGGIRYAVFRTGEVLTQMDKGEHACGKEKLSQAQGQEQSTTKPRRTGRACGRRVGGQGQAGNPEKFQRK